LKVIGLFFSSIRSKKDTVKRYLLLQMACCCPECTTNWMPRCRLCPQ